MVLEQAYKMQGYQVQTLCLISSMLCRKFLIEMKRVDTDMSNCIFLKLTCFVSNISVFQIRDLLIYSSAIKMLISSPFLHLTNRKKSEWVEHLKNTNWVGRVQGNIFCFYVLCPYYMPLTAPFPVFKCDFCRTC